MRVTEFTPKIFTTLREGYGPAGLRADALAGLTVAIVALPLAMALAIASGASPDKGLVTAVVAGFLISFLGGSRVQIGGPTGAFVVVIYNVIAQHGYDGLLLATLLAGVILVCAGYARLGQIIKYIPHPVITGFTAGIAVIIASSQVKDFLGLQLDDVPADFVAKWGAYFGAMDTVSLATLALGAAAFILILALRRYAPKMPAYLMAVVAASVVAALFHMDVDTIGSRFPDIPAGLPAPQWPVWDFQMLRAVMPSAFAIAFLAGIEALLSAVVADGMTGYRHRSNQELVGQGVANIASAMFGGLPATGAIARTATNVKAGGRTPMAGIFHALFLLLFMMFAMDLMAFVPMAALAAILFVVAWGMSEARSFVHIFRLSASDRTVMVLTFLLTVLVDLTVAIGVGVTLASLLFVRHMTSGVEIGFERGHEGAAHDDMGDDEGQRAALPDGVEVFKIAGPVFFGMTGNLVNTLQSMAAMPKVLIVRMRYVPYLDAAGAATIHDLARRCRKAGTRLIISGLRAQPQMILRNEDIADGREDVIFTAGYPSALKAAEDIIAALAQAAEDAAAAARHEDEA